MQSAIWRRKLCGSARRSGRPAASCDGAASGCIEMATAPLTAAHPATAAAMAARRIVMSRSSNCGLADLLSADDRLDTPERLVVGGNSGRHVGAFPRTYP